MPIVVFHADTAQQAKGMLAVIASTQNSSLIDKEYARYCTDRIVREGDQDFIRVWLGANMCRWIAHQIDQFIQWGILEESSLLGLKRRELEVIAFQWLPGPDSDPIEQDNYTEEEFA